MRRSISCTLLFALTMFTAWAQDPTPFTGPDGKFGLKDAQGNVLTEPKYDQIHRFIDGFAIVSTPNGSTFVNRKGEEVIPVRYRSITAFTNGTATAERKMDAKGPTLDFLIDTTGKELFPEGSRFHIMFHEGIARLKLEHGWAYIDRKGKRINSLHFDEATNFQEGFAVVKKTGKYGMIDKQGHFVLPLEYPDLKRMSNGLAAFLEIPMFGDSAYGFVNKEGKVVIKPQYNATSPFAPNGLAGVCKNYGGKCGYIDKNGYEVIKFEYNNVGRFKGDLAEVTKGNRTFFIDRTGKEVTPPRKFTIKPNDYKEGLAVTEDKETGKFGYKDKKGNVVIDHLYDEAYAFNNGLAAVKDNGKFGAVNKKGEVVIPLKYESVSTLRHGLVPVQYQGKWYYFDVMGYAKGFSMAYDRAFPLSDGMGLVCRDNRWGYVDSTAREVIPLQYTRAAKFEQGLAPVFVGSKLKYGYIDRQNNIVIAPKYDEAKPFTKEGKAEVTIGSKTFWIDRTGKKLKE